MNNPDTHRRRGLTRRAAPLLAAALVGGLAAGGVVAFADTFEGDTTTVVRESSPATGALSFASSRGASVQEIYRKAAPGVVKITASSGGSSAAPFGFGGQGDALGSGFVIDTEGHVVTNYHVVENADSVKVSFSNKDELDATVVGSDPSTDLALLKVESEHLLTPLPLGDSSALTVGDDVLAIGNPFGLERTVTAGIVSALGRRIEAPNDFAIDDAIQTDAALNSGNSGGPLLDAAGRVIGVNSQIASQSGGNVGIGYAVPVNTLRSVVQELLADGKVERAYLGIQMQTVTAELAQSLSLGEAKGVFVSSVRSDSPAEQAGVRGGEDGDVITAIDGKPVTTAEALSAAVAAKDPGDSVTLVVRRNGATERLSVTLGERPS
ncbi:MAG: trypsin-like peptidase domain-containing protein [Actinobacteria bacterium]|nr:trypsin-like peptidase domain-containing protein [Actinomycetota bacterium]